MLSFSCCWWVQIGLEYHKDALFNDHILSTLIQILLLDWCILNWRFLLVFTWNEAALSTTWAHLKARRFRSCCLCLLSLTALEAGGRCPSPAPLYVGRNFPHDSLSTRKRPSLLPLSQLHWVCWSRIASKWVCMQAVSTN